MSASRPDEEERLAQLVPVDRLEAEGYGPSLPLFRGASA